jgi:hypothetical protein
VLLKIFNSQNSTKNFEKVSPDFYMQFKKVAKNIEGCFFNDLYIFSLQPNLWIMAITKNYFFFQPHTHKTKGLLGGTN